MQRLRSLALVLATLAPAATAQERGGLMDEVLETLERRYHDAEVRAELPRLAPPFVERARRARTLHEERLEGAGVTPDVPVAYPLPWTAGDDPLLRAGLLAAEAWCDELR